MHYEGTALAHTRGTAFVGILRLLIHHEVGINGIEIVLFS
jgi:hypothetical protein